MAKGLRVGLVGADAAGKGWGPAAHVPALRGLGGVELAAVGTRRPASAAAAAAAYGVPGFHDVGEMAASADVDLVAVVVKVPGHRAAVMAALDAGKPVLSEWPLGLDTTEAEAMARRARDRGVATAVGLQGRHTPQLAYMKALVEQGWIGEVLSVDVQWLTPGGGPDAPRPPAVPGASMFAVGGGHVLDCATHVFGPLAAVSATIDGDVDDLHGIRAVALTGPLVRGGVLSLRLATVPHHASGWRMTAHGTRGTLVASTGLMPQITPITLRGAQGDAPLAEIAAPEAYATVTGTLPAGPPQGVGRSYARLAQSIADGTRFRADFDDAVALHRQLDAIRRSAREGRTVQLAPG